MDDPVALLRHNILGHLTVIKNALSFVLEGQTGQLSEQTRKFLDEAYKRNEEIINIVIKTREDKT